MITTLATTILAFVAGLSKVETAVAVAINVALTPAQILLLPYFADAFFVLQRQLQQGDFLATVGKGEEEQQQQQQQWPSTQLMAALETGDIPHVLRSTGMIIAVAVIPWLVLAVLCIGVLKLFSRGGGRGGAQKNRGTDVGGYVCDDDGKTTVHIKGFAQRINWDSPRTRKQRANFLNRVNQLHEAGEVKKIIFDGDSFEEDSFTVLIEHIATQVCPDVKLVAFVLKSRLNRFALSWNQAAKKSATTSSGSASSTLLNRLTILEVSDEDLVPSKSLPENIRRGGSNKTDDSAFLQLLERKRFVALGVFALEETKSKRVLCFGGGESVEEEFMEGKKKIQKNRSSPLVSWEVFHVNRSSGGGDNHEEEKCALAEVNDDNVVHHRL